MPSTKEPLFRGLLLPVLCRTRIQAPTWIWIPYPMATLHYAENVHIAQTPEPGLGSQSVYGNENNPKGKSLVAETEMGCLDNVFVANER